MLQRKYFMFGAILVLSILIILLIQNLGSGFVFNEDPECRNDLCLHFCCKSENCNQKYIDEHFDIRDLEKREKLFSDQNGKVKFVMKKFNCSLRHIKDEEDWIILDVIILKYFKN